jgi:hypothetical protein
MRHARARCLPNALLECHGVHACAFADEQLHDAQITVPSRFVQRSEAFAATEKGGEWQGKEILLNVSKCNAPDALCVARTTQYPLAL